MSTNTFTLDDLVTRWQTAPADRRAAALAALSGEKADPAPGKALNLSAAANHR